MTKKEFRRLKVGDKVIVNIDLKDHYGETWQEAGDEAEIKKFTPDGIGVIFTWSDLGTIYKNITLKSE